MRRRDPRAGFTLIEVLAALAITGALLSVALPYAARLVTRWWVGERTVESADGWTQALARLDDDLSQALPLAIPTDGKAVMAFRADQTFIQFVRPTLGQSSGASLETVRFEIRSSASGTALVRRTRRFTQDSFFGDAGSSGSPSTLLDGPFRLRFASLGKELVPEPVWEGDADMPVAVELSVSATSREPVPAGPILLPIAAKALSGAPTVR